MSDEFQAAEGAPKEPPTAGVFRRARRDFSEALDEFPHSGIDDTLRVLREGAVSLYGGLSTLPTKETYERTFVVSEDELVKLDVFPGEMKIERRVRNPAGNFDITSFQYEGEEMTGGPFETLDITHITEDPTVVGKENSKELSRVLGIMPGDKPLSLHLESPTGDDPGGSFILTTPTFYEQKNEFVYAVASNPGDTRLGSDVLRGLMKESDHPMTGEHDKTTLEGHLATLGRQCGDMFGALSKIDLTVPATSA